MHHLFIVFLSYSSNNLLAVYSIYANDVYILNICKAFIWSYTLCCRRRTPCPCPGGDDSWGGAAGLGWMERGRCYLVHYLAYESVIFWECFGSIKQKQNHKNPHSHTTPISWHVGQFHSKSLYHLSVWSDQGHSLSIPLFTILFCYFCSFFSFLLVS